MIFDTGVVVLFPGQDVKRQLAHLKVEKEDVDLALKDSKKKIQTLEHKNKVRTVQQYGFIVVTCNCIDIWCG